MRMPPPVPPQQPPIDPTTGLPTGILEEIENLAAETAALRNEFVRTAEVFTGLFRGLNTLVSAVRSAIQAHAEWQRAMVDANKAALSYYEALQEVYGAIPAATTAFTEFSQAATETANAVKNLTTTVVEFGAAFYSGFIAPALRAGDAAALITGAMDLISRGIELAGRALTNLQSLFSNIATAIERAINAIIGPINSLGRVLTNASTTIATAFTSVETALTRGVEATGKFFSSLSNVVAPLGELFSDRFLRGTAAFLNALQDTYGAFGELMENFVGIFRARFAEFVAVWETAITELQRQLQPVIIELTKLQQIFATIGNTVGFVSQIVRTLGEIIGTFIGIFKEFAGTWLGLLQQLAPVQQALNIIGVSVRDTTAAIVASVEAVDAYTNALSVVEAAGRRALLSLSAVASAVETFNNAGLIPSTRLLGQMADAVATLAERLGVMPDELANAITQFLMGGENLRRYFPTLTRGALEVAMYRQFGVFSLPAPLAVPFAAQFLERATQVAFPAGGAPASLVLFAQEMRTLGQQLQAMFARAEPFGGAEILTEIRNLIRELVHGEIGTNLRMFFRFVSTGVATGLQAFLQGFAQLARSPILQELGRGIGGILYAIGAALRDVLTERLAGLNINDLRNFLTNIAANIYAFIRAGVDYAVGLVQALIGFLQRMFSGGGIVQFITTILTFFSRGMEIGVKIGEAVTTLAVGISKQVEGLIQQVATIVYWMRIISAIVEIIGGIAIGFASMFLAPTVIGTILGIGTGVVLITHGFKELTKATTQTPQRVLENLGLPQFRQTMEEINNDFKQMRAQMAGTNLSVSGLQQGLEEFSRSVTELNNRFLQNFNAYRDQFRESVGRFVEGMDRAAEATRQFVARLIQYIEPIFRSLTEVGQMAGEMRRRFAPILPGTLFAPVTVGGEQPIFQMGPLSLPFGGGPPAIGALLEMFPRQMQAILSARILQALQTLPPETVAGIPQGEIQRLWRDLINAIVQDIQSATQAISENLEILNTRLAFFDTTVRINVAMGARALTTTFNLFAASMRAAAASTVEAGMAFALLDQLRAAYPGIERTAAFQRLLNEALQQTTRLLDEISNRMLRLVEIFRRAMAIIGDTFAEMVAWGYRAGDALAGLQSLVEGGVDGLRRILDAARGQLRPTAEDLTTAISAAWQSMLATISAETARAFQQLLAGNIEAFLDNLRSVQQRILQLPEEYINRVRQLSNIAMRPLNYMLEIIGDIRSTLGMVGAEMALFPFILSRAIPALIEMRNQWQGVAEQAARVGDTITFAEALRNVNELQRRIMELLGVTGMFLPAYTPEQMLRMSLRIGMPGLAEIRELARGGLLIEPAAFRAVPIPLAQFFGLPAPASARIRPDIFGGFPFIFSALPMLGPEAIYGGFRAIQEQGFAQMFPAAMQTLLLREQLSGLMGAGYQRMLNIIYGMQPQFAGFGQMLLQNLTAQFGNALPPWLLQGGFTPPPPTPLGATSPLIRFTSTEPMVVQTAYREISNAILMLRDAFSHFNLRFTAEPLHVTIPIEIEISDARSGEVLRRMERSLEIRLHRFQPS